MRDQVQKGGHEDLSWCNRTGCKYIFCLFCPLTRDPSPPNGTPTSSSTQPNHPVPSTPPTSTIASQASRPPPPTSRETQTTSGNTTPTSTTPPGTTSSDARTRDTPGDSSTHGLSSAVNAMMPGTTVVATETLTYPTTTVVTIAIFTHSTTAPLVGGSPTQSSVSLPPSSPPHSRGLPAGTIVGIVLGIITVLLLFGGWWWWKRRSKRALSWGECDICTNAPQHKTTDPFCHSYARGRQPRSTHGSIIWTLVVVHVGRLPYTKRVT